MLLNWHAADSSNGLLHGLLHVCKLICFLIHCHRCGLFIHHLRSKATDEASFQIFVQKLGLYIWLSVRGSAPLRAKLGKQHDTCLSL